MSRLTANSRELIAPARSGLNAAIDRLPETEAAGPGRATTRGLRAATDHGAGRPYPNDAELHQGAPIGLRRMIGAATCLVEDFQARTFDWVPNWRSLRWSSCSPGLKFTQIAAEAGDAP